MSSHSSILFVQTGGTIDKDYPQIMSSYAFEISDSAAKKWLRKLKPNFKYRIVELLKKDSLELTSNDRLEIRETCFASSEKRIIITHGTDTMTRTAEVLSELSGKVIVLTGAMLPAIHVESDAIFNLGTAIGAVHTLNEGVYIAMSGRVYAWDKCVKSSRSMKFVSRNCK